ncbi:arf-GAP with GTPase, ANK repeat and PH domain-containing protein 1-like [Moschus berezovskii]|uniref:arf-GAP with GTPase, ANK repeat and PH domain-containing protein 1-like n=1 Tax=Moschus berezovskii TaxID=68408 RepID=UPI00244481DA|nr:arf-GAP with GTPase, ANK repeat and PH domain-containing protein 1-like [Moschus berezovskii]
MNYQQQLANSAAIRAEIQRFESVHPNIYSIYELLERVEEPVLQNQIREHVIAIEEHDHSAGSCNRTQSFPRLVPCWFGIRRICGSGAIRMSWCQIPGAVQTQQGQGACYLCIECEVPGLQGDPPSPS